MSMIFKNVHVYLIHGESPVSAEDLAAALEDNASRPIGGSEGRRHGWVPPGGRNSQVYLHEVNGQRLMTMLRQERLLPAGVVAEEVDERAAAREAEDGHPLARRERQAIKEQVHEEFLPRAFVRSQRIDVWWDTTRQRIIVNAASRARAEDALDLLRQTLGSLQVTPLATQLTPSRAMTDWLTDPTQRPDWMQLGDQVDLQDNSDDSVIRGRQIDLDSDEIRTHLDSGRQATKLAIDIDESVSLALTDGLALKSLRFADAVLDQAAQTEDGDDPIARLEADFAIATDVLGHALDKLIDALGGEAEAVATPNEQDASQPALGGDTDPLYPQAVEFVTSSQRASVSAIQRAFKIGYNRAAHLVDALESGGIVSPMDNQGRRTVTGGAS